MKKLSISKNTVNLTRLASFYVLIDAIFSLPIAVTLIVYHFNRDNDIGGEFKAILFYSSYMFFLFHCPANAVCFLVVNKEAKTRIMSFFFKSKVNNFQLANRESTTEH